MLVYRGQASNVEVMQRVTFARRTSWGMGSTIKRSKVIVFRIERDTSYEGAGFG